MSSLESSQSNKQINTSNDSLPHTSVTYAGAGNEYVIIEGRKYLRHELMSAFGGTFNPGLAPYPKHQFGNASALAMSSFAVTVFVLGLFYSGAMGITIPNVAVSVCLFYGGVGMFVSGIWELVIGNTFAGTVFAGYSTFAFSFATIFIDSFGIQKAYAEHPEQFGNAVGLYLVGWSVYTFINITHCFKATVSFVVLFLTLDLAFIFLAAGFMTGRPNLLKAGGIFATISSISGFWNFYAGIANPTNSYFRLPVFPIPAYQSKKKEAQ
ncbi:membrane protein [Scheffersomyces stipitis CBS 6054]|uniref:Membrane protein n=1 Tax=Scheffersomyces stipitis (strain ATCC 58785 / CBS 6054 / NBRC 10063 / NRRL Y-11545) TaxID=322104 RepID=A3LT18_PICST|nr:membrane protein [Scheffersomyces stipitis CBS 6054]ABN66334.2 membrane protein [Scheffersomyces stipitis CBS 6054]KAG2733322.1 hypothetical protein G9P44_004312 [Scheffersomyces stipitis]